MSQSKKSGFTLIELLVVISIIALLLGILVPVLGAAKKNANVMKEGANMRNVHVAMVTYGTANKDFFPGLTSKGKYSGWDTATSTAVDFVGKYYAALTNAASVSTAVDKDLGATADYAQAVIMDEGGTTPEQWISTGETSTTGGNTVRATPIGQATPAPNGTTAITDHTTGLVNADNNSYAQLAYGSTTLTAEWHSNQNQMSVVFGTRALEYEAASFQLSATESFNTVWTDANSGNFRGSLVRGDSSTTNETFKAAALKETFGNLKYGTIVGTFQGAGATHLGVYGNVAVADGTVAAYGTASDNFGAFATTAGVFDTVMIGSENN